MAVDTGSKIGSMVRKSALWTTENDSAARIKPFRLGLRYRWPQGGLLLQARYRPLFLSRRLSFFLRRIFVYRVLGVEVAGGTVGSLSAVESLKATGTAPPRGTQTIVDHPHKPGSIGINPAVPRPLAALPLL